MDFRSNELAKFIKESILEVGIKNSVPVPSNTLDLILPHRNRRDSLVALRCLIGYSIVWRNSPCPCKRFKSQCTAVVIQVSKPYGFLQTEVTTTVIFYLEMQVFFIIFKSFILNYSIFISV